MLKKSFFFKKLCIVTSAASLLFVLNANAFNVQNQVDTVGNLLLKSSAARKVSASDDKEIKALYQQAKDYYQQAKESKDPADIKRLLDLTVKQMVKVGKMADQGAALGDKWKNDFNNRLASIEALLSAQVSVLAEKSGEEHKNVRPKVDELVSQAKVQYNNFDYSEGRATLDQAYELLKASIAQMRGGDTLVNSLVFETPAEEFAYYQTKTSSQMTALNMFKAKATKASKQRMIGSITKSAQQFIDDATKLAGDDDYDKAIPLMEKALTRLQSGLMMALN